MNNRVCLVLINIFIRILFVFLIIYLFNLNEFYFQSISITELLKGFIALLTILLLYMRFKTIDDMKNNQEQQYHITNQHKNFLEIINTLTHKDSTIEAKIASMYLLYDYSKNYPKEIEKVYQLLGEYIKPLFKCIDKKCDKNEYKTTILNKKITSNSVKTTIEFNKIKNLDIDIYQGDKVVKFINNWQIYGNETQKEISIALIIIRDLSINILQNITTHTDLSNIIIFNLQVEFYKNKNVQFKSFEKPTYNLIFLNCKLDGVDFSSSKFYYCKFINCSLKSANFSYSELNYSQFINCDLDESNFVKANLESIKFIKSDLQGSKFSNKLNVNMLEECSNVSKI